MVEKKKQDPVNVGSKRQDVDPQQVDVAGLVTFLNKRSPEQREYLTLEGH